MKRSWLLVLISVGILAIGAGAFLLRRAPRPIPAKPAIAPLPPAPAPTEITLTGTVRQANVMNVPAPIDGTIDQFRAEVGQHVQEGEVLARIKNPKLDAAEQTAQLDADQARNHLHALESGLLAARMEVSRSQADSTRLKALLEVAQKDFQRQQTMFREGITARLAFEKAEREYDSLKAESLRIESAVKESTERVSSITQELEPARKAVVQKTNALEDAQAEAAVGEADSPADGIVIARRVKPGQPVTTAVNDLFQI